MKQHKTRPDWREWRQRAWALKQQVKAERHCSSTWVHHGWEDFMWQSHGHFIQLAIWQRHWEATPRETRINRPTAKSQRAVTPIILPPSEMTKPSQSKVS